MTYHHGALRPALLEAALLVLGEAGPGSLSMREVSRRAGVSHAAAAHHFGDKRGLLTAVAVEGFALLADELERASVAATSFADLGVTYVRFALEHPAHFSVMFRPELQHRDDPELVAQGARAFGELADRVRALDPGTTGDHPAVAAVAAWSLVHGFASLWLDGALADAAGDVAPEELARAVAGLLFGPGPTRFGETGPGDTLDP